MLKIVQESENIKLDKDKEYVNYIEEHLSNVQKAFNELCDKDIPEIQEYLNELHQKVKDHDNSKYSDEEFDAYRKNFYPINNEEKESNKDDFDKAWEHHYRNNDHHWQYWTDDDTNLKPFSEQNEREIRLAYLEMIIDWTAMGYKFGDTAYQYYKEHENEIKLYPQLKDWIINIMEELNGND